MAPLFFQLSADMQVLQCMQVCSVVVVGVSVVVAGHKTAAVLFWPSQDWLNRVQYYHLRPNSSGTVWYIGFIIGFSPEDIDMFVV